jgi:putative ABC transport system permease protein
VFAPLGKPAEVESLEALSVFPLWLAIGFVILVGIPVIHSLLISVRGRRRDLAVMSAIGATPTTLRWIGIVLGVTVVFAGIVVGVPLGIVIGRWSWSGLALSFGTVAEPVVPLVSVAAIGVGVLVVGALVGGTPVWTTRRATTVAALRPE